MDIQPLTAQELEDAQKLIPQFVSNYVSAVQAIRGRLEEILVPAKEVLIARGEVVEA
jgi:hypothetical protein